MIKKNKEIEKEFNPFSKGLFKRVNSDFQK